MARRIADYGFEDGKDFCSFLSESSGGRPSKEYHLSLDMAKELSMVERNEKGKQARQYFIVCERRAKDPLAALSDPTAMSGSSLAYTDRRYGATRHMQGNASRNAHAFHQSVHALPATLAPTQASQARKGHGQVMRG